MKSLIATLLVITAARAQDLLSDVTLVTAYTSVSGYFKGKAAGNITTEQNFTNFVSYLNPNTS